MSWATRSPASGEGGLGSRQVAILRTVHGGQRFDTSKSNSNYRACMRLEARRLLGRVAGEPYVFTSSTEGEALIERRDDALEAKVAGRCET